MLHLVGAGWRPSGARGLMAAFSPALRPGLLTGAAPRLSDGVIGRIYLVDHGLAGDGLAMAPVR